ncbi:MAG: hypothetical protein AAF614_21700 [Chloroflexota bacterium]
MKLLTFNYDTACIPSAPFIEIETNGYDERQGTLTVLAFVDSGADGAMIPINLLPAVGAEYEDTQILLGTAVNASGLNALPLALALAMNG